MPRLPGLEALKAIMSRSPRVKIVLLTSTISTQQVIEALQIGARGIVLKSALTEQIASALLAVMEGGFWVNGRRLELLSAVLSELRAQIRQESSERYRLTRRELEVVGLIVKGYSNRDIAKQFNLSEETVKRHLSNTFEKLNISTRLELAIFALANKLVPPQDGP